MKKQGLIALNEIIQDDDRSVKVAVEIDNRVTILRGLISSGIIAPLISVLEYGKIGLSKKFAAKCLMKLTENSDSSWSISAHGGVTIFLKICIEGGGDEVSSKDEVIQISSTDFVQTMASMDESTRQIIMKESGIRALGHVLDPKSSSLYKSREMTLRRIVNWYFSLVNSVNIPLNYGFMYHILYFLGHGDGSIQELALNVTFWLCGIS
ncbi:hypothetical protein BC332_32161 [Capsicum chinense]|nr:hypothetical protein BC332_32161 [Capsicum chinense]